MYIKHLLIGEKFPENELNVGRSFVALSLALPPHVPALD